MNPASLPPSAPEATTAGAAPPVRALLISAIASGQGKTSVTAALARKFGQQGLRVRVFKTGADFIDPMLLARACGAPVYSLDLWLLGIDACCALLAQAAQEADVILIEGVMGLYDGTPSSADLARAFGVPVLLVIDASAMAQTAGAVVLGLREFGPVEVAGVVANRVGSAAHAQMVAASLRDVPLLASLPRQLQALPERHLGLVLPDEVAELDTLLDALAAELVLDDAVWQRMPQVRFPAHSSIHSSNHGSTHNSTHIPAACEATSSVAVASPQGSTSPFSEAIHSPCTPAPLQGKIIAIARDAAFAFIYPANPDCLYALGADLVYFSPLQDEAIPAQADALYLPGGYPELHAAQLAAASQWQASLHAAHARAMPILAECGGMMALADSICDKNGQSWPMAGLLPGSIVMQTRLAALGPQSWCTVHGTLRGHAFHFSRFETGLAPLTHAQAYRPAASIEAPGEAIYRLGNLTASYFHSYFPSCPRSTASLFLPQQTNTPTSIQSLA